MNTNKLFLHICFLSAESLYETSGFKKTTISTNIFFKLLYDFQNITSSKIGYENSLTFWSRNSSYFSKTQFFKYTIKTTSIIFNAICNNFYPVSRSLIYLTISSGALSSSRKPYNWNKLIKLKQPNCQRDRIDSAYTRERELVQGGGVGGSLS